MAQIAEPLLLLLLDNASGQPALERPRRERALAAAVLLDLAYACRIRPAVDTDPVRAGLLMVLSGPAPVDPVVVPALQLLQRRPLSPAVAITKLRRGTPAVLLRQLQRGGQVTHIRQRTKRLKRSSAWPLTNRTRAAQARAAVLSALFDNHHPDPATATIISLLRAVNGLDSLLSLTDRGWEWVDDRAGEIASGSWVAESEPELPEINLAVTTAAVCRALKKLG